MLPEVMFIRTAQVWSAPALTLKSWSKALVLVAPPLFGRFDPGDARRRRWLFNYTLGCAGIFGLLALSLGATSDVALSRQAPMWISAAAMGARLFSLSMFSEIGVALSVPGGAVLLWQGVRGGPARRASEPGHG
mgnify:CR=1 FL=1